MMKTASLVMYGKLTLPNRVSTLLLMIAFTDGQITSLKSGKGILGFIYPVLYRIYYIFGSGMLG